MADDSTQPDCSFCHCEQAGWCELYKKKMTSNPPNWQWCQSLTSEQRAAYYKKCKKGFRSILAAASASQVDVFQFYDKLPERKSDYAVCVIANNDSEEFLGVTRKWMRAYAERCGADYIELLGDQNPEWPMSNKYRLSQVTKTYEKTVYFDCDVVVREDTPNLFTETPDDKISAYDEWGCWVDREDTGWILTQQELIAHKILDVKDRDQYLQNGRFENKKMLNGGVLVIPKSLWHYYQQPNKPYPRQWCFDQNYLTLLLPESKLNRLSYKFNCSYTERQFYIKQRDSHIIHVNNLRYEKEKRKELLENMYEKGGKWNDLAVHEDVSTSRQYHICEAALRHQEKANKELVEYINGQTEKKKSVNRVCILVLGHSQKQFDTIENRPYLKKVNLNTLNAGEFSGNEWAESRAFLSNTELFPKSAEFYGVVTASWNKKYYYSEIDNFHNWFSTQVLLNSEPEDNVVLCADLFCSCNWLNNDACFNGNCVLNSVLSKEYYNNADICRAFLRLFKLRPAHKRVAYSNQFICHKSLYMEYMKFLKEHDAATKVKWFVEKVVTSKYPEVIWSDKYRNHYSATRIYAYFFEMLTVFWFSQGDYKFIANGARSNSWYNQQSIVERLHNW